MRRASRFLVAIVLVACGSDGTTAVETVATMRFVTQPTNITAGQSFSVSVELLNQNGIRMTTGNQGVSLSLVGGAGTLGGTATTTAVSGLATFSGLSVTKAGTNMALAASSATLSANSSPFSVHAGTANAQQSSVSASPAPVAINTGTLLTFTFKDSYGNPASAASVSLSSSVVGSTFTPSSGTTGSDGTFVTTFRTPTVGATPITATVDGAAVNLESLTVIDPCANLSTYTLGTTVAGTLAVNSCSSTTSPFAPRDIYTYTLTAQTLVNFTLSSSDVPPGLAPVIPSSGASTWSSALSVPGSINRAVLARPGTYQLIAGSLDRTKVGSYTLSSVLNPNVSAGCWFIYTTLGVSSTFATATSGCTFTPASLTGTFYAVPFYMNVPLPATLSVHVIGTGSFLPLVEIRNQAGTVIASSSSQTGATVAVTSAVTSGAVIVYVTSRTAGVTGGFSITIDP